MRTYRKTEVLLYVFSLSLLVNLLSFATVSAEPTISAVSGSMTHKDSVTIAGLNFGSRPSSEPVKWDDFEDGFNGQTLGNGWTKFTASGDDPAHYTTTVLRKGSNVSVECAMIKAYDVSFGYDWAKPPSPNRFYLTFWRNNHVIGTHSDNYKSIRFYGNASNGEPQAWYGVQNGTSPFIVVQHYDGSSAVNWFSKLTENEQWVREEYYLDMGSEGKSDGTFYYWIQNQKDKVALRGALTNQKFLTDSYRIDKIRIGHYWNQNAGDLRAYFDDVYIDLTQARVEIGNAPSWGSCTFREIQIPSAWSDSSITFTVNRGSFGDGNNAYLYVVDSNGNVNSQGYPIIIGASNPGSELISAPKNLIVVPSNP